MPPAANPNALDGLYYGLLLGLALWNAGAWLTLRDRTFLMHVALIASFGFSAFLWDGFGWPGREPAPGGLEQTALVLADALAAAAAVAFTRSFLETRRRLPRFDGALIAVGGLAAATAAVALPATLRFARPLWTLLALAGPPLLLATALAARRLHTAASGHYLVAVGGLLAGLSLEAVGDTLAPGTALAAAGEAAARAGTLSMAFVLSHGLVLRYRVGRRERDRLEAERRELGRIARTDPLTGIANRRGFDETLGESFGRALQGDGAVALAFFDVDHFKAFNDTRGHPAGDACLRAVARALDSSPAPGMRLLARTGGEEFAAILEDVTTEEAVAAAEGLRRAVEALGIDHGASEASPVVTVSVGVARLVPEPGLEPKHLVDAADRALYRAKEAGRNRVVAATAPSARAR